MIANKEITINCLTSLPSHWLHSNLGGNISRDGKFYGYRDDNLNEVATARTVMSLMPMSSTPDADINTAAVNRMLTLHSIVKFIDACKSRLPPSNPDKENKHFPHD